MAIYSIKDLEKLTGIKAHTIRIWEQRYKIVVPKRTRTNIRYYDDQDLKSLLNIALLNKNGIKISKISKMTESNIAIEVAKLSEVNFENSTQLDALTISMIEMDEYKFDKIITINIEQLGFERTMLEIINPFLEKLSILWLTGSINPAQEHFISCLIRQKIIASIDKIPFTTRKDAPKYLVFLPEGEINELSLLFFTYLIRERYNKVIYLGQNIPFMDLQAIYQVHKPEFVCTMISGGFSKEPVQSYVDKLAFHFPDSQILLSGYQVLAQPIKCPDNTTIIRNFEHTIETLNRFVQPSKKFSKKLNKQSIHS